MLLPGSNMDPAQYLKGKNSKFSLKVHKIVKLIQNQKIPRAQTMEKMPVFL